MESAVSQSDFKHMKNTDVFVIAGEASGDLHASSLIKELKLISKDVSVEGIGGSLLIEAGAKLIFNYSEVNFVGFKEIAENYAGIKKKLKYTRDYILQTQPKTVVLVDFPGFNLRIAKEIRKSFSGKIIYYITPQVWAWHRSRVRQIRKYIDKCLVIFPFEKKLFDNEGIDSAYVGHPLIKPVTDFLLNKEKKMNPMPVVTLMPGSRIQEVRRILPVLCETSKELIEKYQCKVNLLCSENIPSGIFDEFDLHPSVEKIDSSLNYETIYNSDFVITKFGTSTLECALLETPFCAVYKAGSFNYLLGKMMIRTDFVALVNIILEKEVVKEFIQKDFCKENIIGEFLNVMNDNKYRNIMLSEFILLKNYFDNFEIGQSAAQIVSGMLNT